MSTINTNQNERTIRIPDDWELVAPAIWKPEVEFTTEGIWQRTGGTPGFWETTWKSQVSGTIDSGFFGDIINFATNPFGMYEGKHAKLDLLNKAVSSVDEEAMRIIRSIEQDNTKTGKDIWDAIPKQLHSEFASLGITPTNLDMPSDVFASDLRQTFASAVYARDIERGYSEYNDFGLFMAGIGTGIVTDPTSLISFGAGKAAGIASKAAKDSIDTKLARAAMRVHDNWGLKSTIALNAGLAAGVTADSLINRSQQSEAMGIDYGRYGSSEIFEETLIAAGLASAIGAGLYGAGYYSSMALNKFSKVTSDTALNIADSIVNTRYKISESEIEGMISKMIAGEALEPKEQIPIFLETMELVYGSKMDATIWDWEAMDAVGITPLNLAFKILTEGYSGKQLQTMIGNAYRVLEDAASVHIAAVGPNISDAQLKANAISEAKSVMIEGPVLPINKELPDFVKEAGYMWGPMGDIVPDPNFVKPSDQTATRKARSELPGTVKEVPKSLYHGTSASFDTFKPSKGMNLVFFTPDKSSSKNYASGGGGQRTSVLNQNGYWINGEGIVYEAVNPKDPKTDYKTIGYSDDDKDFSILPIPDKLKTKYFKETATLEDLKKYQAGGELRFESKSARIIEKDFSNLNFLDLKSKEGLDILGSLNPKNNPRAAEIINKAKTDIRKFSGKGRFDWTSTKHETTSGAMDVIIEQLKEKGYDGIFYADDGHDTFAVFGNIEDVDFSAKSSESTKVYSAASTATVPVKQPLLPETSRPLVAEVSKESAEISAIKSLFGPMIEKSKDYNEFVALIWKKSEKDKKLESLIESGKLDQIIKGSDKAKDFYAQAKGAKKEVATLESLKAELDSLGILSKDHGTVIKEKSNNTGTNLEIPDISDRLIWMSNRKGISNDIIRLLGKYYGMNRQNVLEAREKMVKAFESREKGQGQKIDRIRIVQEGNNYKIETIRIAKDPNVRPKSSTIAKAVAPKRKSSKAENYVNRRNAAIQRAIDRKRKSLVAKAEGRQSIDTTKISTDGIKDESAAEAYKKLIANGEIEQAFGLLNNFTVGEGNFAKITELSNMTILAKNDLEEAVRLGDPEKINKAKKVFEDFNETLEKYKQRLFAVSPKTDFFKVAITPLDVQKGAVSRFKLGTPYEPATQFYVEPIGEDGGEASHRAVTILDRAFMLSDHSTIAAKIDTDIPKGFWSYIGDSIGSINSKLFLQSEAGRLLYNKMPIVGQIVNMLHPSTLSNSRDIGSTEMVPSLSTRYERMQAEANYIVTKAWKDLKELNILPDSPEMKKVVWDAIVERNAGRELATTSNRNATDIAKKVLKYFDSSSEEGVRVGKIREVDPTYVRITLNDDARRNVSDVGNAYHDAAIVAFSADDSDIHEPTLLTITQIKIVDKEGDPIVTLKDLKETNPDIADKYLKALASKDKNSPLNTFANKAMKVFMGLDVTDDVNIIREVSSYMNSGIGKKLDTAIMLDPRMRKYIETDLYRMLDEYNRNVRYQFAKQDTVNRFLSMLTGQRISGITFADAMNYFNGKLIEHMPDSTEEIKKTFAAIVNKEMQITNRSRHNKESSNVLDATLSLVASPVQSLVAGGVSFTSSIAESAKMFGTSMLTAMAGKGGSKSIIKNILSMIKGMSKADILASRAAIMSSYTHGQLIEVDSPVFNYRGTYLSTKMANITQPFKTLGSAISTPTSSTSNKVSNILKATANAVVEPVRQVFHLDNFNALNYRGYYTQGMYKMAEVLEQMVKNPDFFKTVTRSEIINRMEEAGLFSPNAVKAVKTIQKYAPDVLFKEFNSEDIYKVLLDLRENPVVSTEDYRNVELWVTSFMGAIDRYADSRIMNVARLWDRPDIDTSPAFNRLMNTFSGYSRWFFSRHMQQVFPNSSYHKVAALLAWYTMAEIFAILLRDSMRDFSTVDELLNSEDDEVFEDIVTKSVMRVPLLGQLTNGTADAIALIWGLFSPESNGSTYQGRPSMFSGKVYYDAIAEAAKMVRGENYDPEKIRKAVPYLNAPIFGGFLKMAEQAE